MPKCAQDLSENYPEGEDKVSARTVTAFSCPMLDSSDQVRLCVNSVVCYHLAHGQGSVNSGQATLGAGSWRTSRVYLMRWVGCQRKRCCLVKVLSEEKTQLISQDLPHRQRGRFVLCGSRGPRKGYQGNRVWFFLPGAPGGSKTRDLGISLANTRWLLLESYGRDSVLRRCQSQIRVSTVSIDSEKGRAIKGHFPKNKFFCYQYFKFPAQVHSEEVRAHELCNFLGCGRIPSGAPF